MSARSVPARITASTPSRLINCCASPALSPACADAQAADQTDAAPHDRIAHRGCINRRCAAAPLRKSKSRPPELSADSLAPYTRCSPDTPTVISRHLLHALCPTRNHLAERKCRGLIALVGTVELGPIHQSAAIVHCHHVGGSRRSARAGSQLAIDQPARGLHRARLGSRLLQIRLRIARSRSRGR